MRIALLADTHGYVDERVAAVVATCDIAVHGGDIGHAGVLAGLSPLLGRVIAVRGNNDVPRKWPPAERDLLSVLPEVTELALPGGRLAVIHGHQLPFKSRHARLRQRFPGVRAVLYGHSHHLVADDGEAPWILNPGAAGRARTYGGPSCLILTVDEGPWSVAVHRFAPLPSGATHRASRQAALCAKAAGSIG